MVEKLLQRIENFRFKHVQRRFKGSAKKYRINFLIIQLSRYLQEIMVEHEIDALFAVYRRTSANCRGEQRV